MESVLVTALLVTGIVALSRLVREGTPTLWELQLRHGRGWPVGVQEENDERPWHHRHGTGEWHPSTPQRPYAGRSHLVARPRRPTGPTASTSTASWIDLTDAGRHAPDWAVEGLVLPSLESVHTTRRRRG